MTRPSARATRRCAMVLHVLLAVAMLNVLSACANRPVNERIDTTDLTTGYRPLLSLARERPGNDHGTLFVLAFSGGGTRAAAFSYGVLEALRSTEVTRGGTPHSLIDEVDLITGVSGGSFTALAYALYGNTLFDTYADSFLKADVQGTLVRRMLDPLVGSQTVGGTFGRSELAANYYDEILFHGATFADLAAKPTPVAIATGTDLSTGARLAFIQTNFDLLCSDLSQVRVSRAAAASSAVPVVLSPVTLNNYGGTCGFRYPAWIEQMTGAHPDRPTGLARERMHDMDEFQKSRTRPYIHLVDGGVSDNLGMRAIIETLEDLESSAGFRQVMEFKDIHRVAVIVVNARSSPSTKWDESEQPPDFVQQLLQASSVPIDRYSYDSVELMKDLVARWGMVRDLAVARAQLAGSSLAQAEAAHPVVEMYVVDVSFAAIPDKEQRRYFENLPTSFVLQPQQVDRLRDEAGRLLRASPQFQRFLNAMGATPAPAVAVSAPPP